jgi:hypothetical protein
MTVTQLVALFESIDQKAAQTDVFHKIARRSFTPQDTNIDSIVDMPSRKMKLSLHTMFNHERSQSQSQSQSRSRSSRRSSRTPIGIRSPITPAPSPAYAFLGRPYTPTASPNDSRLLSPASSTSTSPASSLNSHPYIRRHPSAVDLALEAERCSVGAENIGLGLLEPRPRAASTARLTPGGEGMCSLMEVLGESRRGTPEVVALDGIFEVLERGR